MSLLISICDKKQLHIDEYCKNIHRNKITCCACDNILIAKKGKINLHHFAHKKNADCVIKRDNDCKTPWHILWQNIAKPEYLEKFMGKNGKMHIADIVNEKNITIEIQHSNLSPEEIENREEFYGNMIWILDGTNTITDNDMISSKYSVMFTTTNNYDIIKVSPKFWRAMNKKKYIDSGFGMYE
jgi:competence CoiA-like predicted nuclease